MDTLSSADNARLHNLIAEYAALNYPIASENVHQAVNAITLLFRWIGIKHSKIDEALITTDSK